MRVSRAEAAENRQRIIEVASKLFRERGFDGIGVVDLMKSAGLTHGGFYGNFASKEDLIALSCEHALERSANTMQQVIERSGENALAAIAAAYLSPAHRDGTAEGCVLAALGAEAARQGSPVRGAFTRSVRSVVDALTKLMPGKLKRAKRQQAIATYASLVGALVLARSVDDAELSDEILRSVQKQIITQTDCDEQRSN